MDQENRPLIDDDVGVSDESEDPEDSGVQDLDGVGASQRQRTRVYRRRWVVLILFAMLSFFQSVSWNTWSAVAPAVEVIMEATSI